MTARARILRAASAVLASALIAGSALMTSTGAFALELDEVPVAQQVEQIVPASDDTSAPALDHEAPVAIPAEVATDDQPASEKPVEENGSDQQAEPTASETTEPEIDDEAPNSESDVEVPVSRAPAVQESKARTSQAEEIDVNEDANVAVSAQALEGTRAGIEDSGAVKSATSKETVTCNIAGDGATFTWGVKSSFRNYIYNIQPKLFKGKSTVMGNTTQPTPEGEFVWCDGLATNDGSGVAFGEGNGVHFQSHPMLVNGVEEWSLDLQFTNPRVILTSANEGELQLDVVGHKFIDMTSVGEQYTLTDVVMADLVLQQSPGADNSVVWTSASATLTDEGSIAFGGFYPPGDELDNITLNLPAGMSLVPPANAKPTPIKTTTKLAVSKKTVTPGGKVSTTATVTPTTSAGTVQFFDGKKKLGKAVKVSKGVASLETKKLSVGKHSLTAKFVPSNAKKFTASTSDAVSVAVEKKLQPTSVEADVSGGTLSWGVKSSFRNYIQGPIAGGEVETVGSVKKNSDASVFTWTKGAGTALTSADAADVKFTGNNGLHFEGHHGILDFTITNPRIVVTSSTNAELYADAKGLKFKDTQTKGASYNYKNLKLADVLLEAPSVSGQTITWTDAEVTLAKSGRVVFGDEFYPAGESLDPISFSFPLDYDGEIVLNDKTTTATKLSASAAEINLDQSVTLTSTTSPAVDGKVTFRVPGASVEKTVTAKKGKATLELSKLEAINYTARATFTPKNSSDYAASNSNSVTVTVNDPGKKSGAATVQGSSTGQSAGSLTWGISSFFAAYTTEKSGSSACPTAGGHCANGEIATSGVGAGWLFPQASTSSWNKESQTGTVQYAGTVAFNGYGQTMFQVSNPSITVNSATSATLNTGYSGSYGPSSVGLNLGSASKSVGSNGEVTWSGVTVQGGLSGIRAGQDSNFDSLSFTVGEASGVSYGSTSAGSDKKIYEVAETAPATTGVTILTDAKKIMAGSRLEIEASGFETDDEGVLVVLYDGNGRNPVVLDEEASANSEGVVSWAGTLPKDVTAKQIITVQGSVDAGAPIDVVKKKASANKKTAAEKIDAPSVEQAQAAGVLGFQTSASGGMATWEWWASAGGLVVIAGCMTALAVRQRKLAA